MIKNDEQFKQVFEEYLKSEGISVNEDFFCGRMNCEDCLFKNLIDCSKTPFWEIKRCEERLAMMKKEIRIMQSWKRKIELGKKLSYVCEMLRSSNNDLSELTCYGISCDKCLFHDMDNFREWARKAKEESLGEEK